MSAPAAEAREPRPRGSLRLVADPLMGPFFLGKLVSTIGVWVHNIAAAIVVFQLTSSAALVGAVSVGQFLPQLILTPWSGARADRADRRRQLVTGRLIGATGSGGLVVWIPTVGLEGTTGAAAVIAAAVVVGIGWSLGGPAMQALVPSLVPRAELAAAVALNSLPPTIGRACGPALGALLVAWSGPTVAFAVAGATHLLFAVILVSLPLRDSRRRRPRDGSILAGLRYVRGDRAVAAVLVGGTAVGIGADPVVTLTPPLADSLGAGPGLVGALATAFGIGSLATFTVLGWIRARLGLPRLATAGLLAFAAGLALVAVSPAAVPALICFGVAGSGMTCALTSLVTLLQQRSPENLRGRLMALWSVTFLGSRPLAAALDGVLADVASANVALLCVAALLVLAAWIAGPGRLAAAVRTADDPTR